ncbi:ribose 5-phosphate isomerase B [Candidatus Woesearchaeota archaeon]|nr:ribose 5-phosphate isomerase B [Candidatus Woesearchaeota archaeon]
MTIYIGSDHAGFKLKEEIKRLLSSMGWDLEDISPFFDENDDYPDHALIVAKRVVEENAKGILICGTGVGMSIVANKVPGIRAALCHTKKEAKISREHNDANILVLSGWNTRAEDLKEIIETFFTTEFEDGRHERRINKIRDIEKKYSK